ncbi:hypothetical protein COB72_08465 [bacterium]|nr:MAG: hypothetical protein COB72_08465 [bacterium]
MLNKFNMLNIFNTRVIASAAFVCGVAGMATSSMVVHADTNPDGDVEIESSGWISSARVDLNQILGATAGPVDGGWLPGAGVDASFIFTGSEPEGDAPSDVAYTPDGSKIVIAHRESRNLIIWDADTLAFLGEIPISGAAQAMAITPDGTKAVVANVDNNTVSIVDLVAMTEIAVIPVGINPGVVRISPAGDVAAVGITFESEIAIIDIASASVIGSIPNIGYGMTISFAPEALATSLRFTQFSFLDDDRLVNADSGADELQIVNVRTGVVDRTPIASSARGLAVSGDGSRIAIAHTGSTKLVTVVDAASGLVLGTISSPDNLNGPITLSGDGTKGVVGVSNAARVFDLSTGLFGGSLNTASINEMLTSFDGRYALCVGFRGAVIDMDTGTLVDQVNNVVSTEHGAVSPIAYRAAMCSTTFGDDLLVVDIEGAAGSLLAFQRTGPEIEGDRCRTVAISADGSRVVGVSILSDNASVIDAGSGLVIGTAPLGERPSAVAISPDGTKAVVGNLDSTFATVINLSDATSTQVNISRRAGSAVISPDGQYAYLGVVASGDGVWRIDLDTNTVAGGKIPTGNMGGVGYSFSQSSGIALSNDGAILAVAGSFDDVVSIIDTASWSLMANLPAGDFPTMISFAADDSRFYATNRNSDSITVYDNSGVAPVFSHTIAVGDSPWQVVDDGQGRIWVNNWADKRISGYDIVTGALVGSVLFDNSPVGLTYDASSNSLRVAHGTVGVTLGGNIGFDISQSGTLTLIDLATLATTDFDLGVGPSALASSSNGMVHVVAAPIGDGVAILNLATGCSAADLNNDGVLNFFDISVFLQAFGAMDLVADFNNDGVLNFFDISAFLIVFGEGCP